MGFEYAIVPETLSEHLFAQKGGKQTLAHDSLCNLTLERWRIPCGLLVPELHELRISRSYAPQGGLTTYKHKTGCRSGPNQQQIEA
jgi:hypothetical protein